MKPPCLLYEDDHLLVVNKPAGLNTHSPSPFAGEGLYEWLRHREPRWASLAIIHRLDKDTSGVMVFSKTALANRSLTEQFTLRQVRKQYLLLTDRPVSPKKLVAKTGLIRVGDVYHCRPIAAGLEVAETRFSVLEQPGSTVGSSTTLVQAEPLTGRTHQIRAHARELGFPILGDTRYGGSPASRLCLHATELRFKHPESGKEVAFRAPADFDSDRVLTLRSALVQPQSTNAYRLINGEPDGWPGWYVDRLGRFLLSHCEKLLSEAQTARLTVLSKTFEARGVYHKTLSPSPRKANLEQASPQHVMGSAAPETFRVLENGLEFELSFVEGYSVGLFLDQRDNRRRLLTGYVAPGFALWESLTKSSRPEILNTFAYTCGFSVNAAKAGARVTSLDLSRKYLDWGKRNFTLNQIDPGAHDFIFGDVFDWLRRLHKKGRIFDIILLDPPTFSQSKYFGPFCAEKDYGKLVSAALPLLTQNGVLFASCNTAGWAPDAFLSAVRKPIQMAGRTIAQEHYVPQPPDFPISRAEPAYLKTIWLRVS